MKKLVFLSCEDLLDVDIPIVKEIHAQFEFTWIIVLRGYGWFAEAPLLKLAQEVGVNLRILHQDTKLKDPRTFLFHLKLLKILKGLKPDLVYDSYHGTPWMHFVSPIYLPRAKFVLAIHDVVQHYNMHFRFVRKHYSNFLMRMHQHIHVFSPSQLAVFNRYYQGKNTLMAPLCLKDFGKLTRPTTKQKEVGEAHFLFFGIIRANKGVDLLIQAVNQLAAVYPKLRVTIAGRSDEAYWASYEQLIAHRDAFNLQIRTIEDYEIPGLFDAHQFILLPYRDVTQSGVLLTAYNYKLPAIASDLMGFSEYIIADKTGMLFDIEKSDGLKDSLEAAILMDNNAYQQMIAALSEFVAAEISTAGIAKKYVDYFNRIN